MKAIGNIRKNRTLGTSNTIKSVKKLKKTEGETFYFGSNGVVYLYLHTCILNNGMITILSTLGVISVHIYPQKPRKVQSKSARCTYHQPNLIK